MHVETGVCAARVVGDVSQRLADVTVHVVDHLLTSDDRVGLRPRLQTTDVVDRHDVQGRLRGGGDLDGGLAAPSGSSSSRRSP